MSGHDVTPDWPMVSVDRILLSLEAGTRPKGGVKTYTDGIPSIGGEHLDSEGSFSFDNIRYVPKSFYDRLNRGKLAIGDVLVVKDGATTGKTSIVRPNFPFREAAVNEHVFLLRVNPKRISPYYLYYFLRSLQGQKQILERFKGSAQGGITRKFVERFPIPLPQLETQTSIVQTLESVHNRSQNTRKELSRISELTRRLRMAILAKAFRGELTKRVPHDEPADVLLERVSQSPPLAAARTRLESTGPDHSRLDAGRLAGLPNQWLWTKLGHLLREPLRNGRSAKPGEPGDGIPVLTLSVVTFKDFGPHNVKSCNLRRNDVKDLWVKNNDILIARSNTADYVGMAVIYQGPDNQFVFPDLMIRARVLDRCILPLYLAHYLDSPIARSYFMGEAHSTAGSMPKIHQGHILNLPVPLAPYNEQQEVIHQLNAMASGIGQIEAVSTRTTVLLAMLEQSVLAKAFSGGLTGSGISS